MALVALRLLEFFWVTQFLQAVKEEPLRPFSISRSVATCFVAVPTRRQKGTAEMTVAAFSCFCGSSTSTVLAWCTPISVHVSVRPLDACVHHRCTLLNHHQHEQQSHLNTAQPTEVNKQTTQQHKEACIWVFLFNSFPGNIEIPAFPSDSFLIRFVSCRFRT